MNIKDYSLQKLVSMIQEKELTSEALVEHIFKNIDEKDGEINAFILLEKDRALSKARGIDARIVRGESVGRLCGIPVAVKDNICVKGMKATAASKILDGFVPNYDATVIELLEQEDAIIIGKTNMDEFGMGSTTKTSYYGYTKNPLALEHSPGGSSGGSAAAVVAEECVCAIGTDTGGSIRQPGAHCGVVGIKPSYGSVSRYGLIAYASSLDQIGPITKSVEDAAYMLDIMIGHDVKDSTSIDIRNIWLDKYGAESGLVDSLTGDVKGKKIAIPENLLTEDTNKEIIDAVKSAANILKEKGAIVQNINLELTDMELPAYYILACAEASSNLARYDGVKYGYRDNEYIKEEYIDDMHSLYDMYKKSRSEGFGTEVKRRIMLGSYVLSKGHYDKYYLKALGIRDDIRKQFDTLYEEYDAVIMPVATTTAPRLDKKEEDPTKVYMDDIYTVIANLAGIPAISIPYGTDSKGLPIGVQLMCGRYEEAKLLNIAYAIERR